MDFISYRELRNETPSALRIKLSSVGVLVITTGNQPIAAMIGLDDKNLQETLLIISRMRAQLAVRAIRSKARRDGLDRMTLKEVNAVISETRAEQLS